MDNKKIKIVKIKGGLGNQLFQYSFAVFIKELFNIDVMLDLSWFKNQKKRQFILPDFVDISLFATSEQNNYSTISKILNYRSEFIFTKMILNKKLPFVNIFDGYWQNKNFADKLKKNKLLKSNFNKPIINENYYVIHLRRTDFKQSKAHNLLDYSYYLKNLKFFSDKKIYALSDDKRELDFIINNTKTNVEIIDCNEKDAFNIIYNSKGGILSNSTFCWWPCYLSGEDNFVLPYNWLKSSNIFDSNLHIDSSLII